MSLGVVVVALGLAVMGLAALVKPAVIWAPFGVVPSTPESRNEVRAVYGGFGVALAVLLFVADGWAPDVRAGVLLTVAIALLGMAGGRAISAFVEPKALIGYPGFFMVLEGGLAALLLAAR
jgi:hypothetical protein